MSTNSNLDDTAAGIIRDALYGMERYDADALRDTANDLTGSAADSAVTYTADALAIIDRYANDPRAADAEDLASGRTWLAAEWRNAMTSYAADIARCVITSDVADALRKIEDAADTLYSAAADYANDDDDTMDDADIRISADCPHGGVAHASKDASGVRYWAPYTGEDAGGLHYWEPGDLEGCRAVAIPVAGVWLSITWAATGGEG